MRTEAGEWIVYTPDGARVGVLHETETWALRLVDNVSGPTGAVSDWARVMADGIMFGVAQLDPPRRLAKDVPELAEYPR